MKKYNIIGLIIINFLIGSSCEVIDQEPISAQSQATFFANSSDANAALMGAYDAMQQLVDDMFVYGEVRSDNVRGSWGSRGQDIHLMYNQTITPDNDYARWAEFYTAINRINGVITFIPGIVEKDPEFTQENADNIVGEALYLRALAYFYLARIWGDVPLVLEPSVDGSADFQIPKNTQEEVLDQVLGDLNFALENQYLNSQFPDNAQTRGRATIGAANGLLASVHLWRGNYQEAADAAKKVMDNSQYTLVPGGNWTDIFTGDQNSSESVFEFQFNLSQQETNSLFFLTNGLSGGAYRVSPSEQMLTLWSDEGDVIRGEGRSWRNSFYKRVFKYEIIVPDDRDVFPQVDLVPIRDPIGNQSDPNYIITRLSDVILMRAEALNRLGQKQEAIDLVNMIRARVGLPTANIVGANDKLTVSASMEQIEDAILHERRLELAFEGHRWFDLMRLSLHEREGLLVDKVMASEAYEIANGQFGTIDKDIPGSEVIQDPNSWYMPIHRQEIQENKNLEQNPYYTGN